jgi:hypothetical protein
MKGELHNLSYVPDGVEDDCLASFCEASPKLLGVECSNLNNATCSAEIDSSDSNSEDEPGCEHSESSEPTRSPESVWRATSSAPWNKNTLETGTVSEPSSNVEWAGGGNHMKSSSEPSQEADRGFNSEADSPVVDKREECGEDLVPIYEAKNRLYDEQWCKQAPYVSGLRDAVREWDSMDDVEGDRPWIPDPDGSELDEDSTSSVVRDS